MKNAGIILVGDELLDGKKPDRNGPFIASELTRAGFQVVSLTVCPDDKNKIESSLGFAFDKSDMVLVAGGLGPTSDDLTRFAASEYFEADLVTDENALNHILGFFEKRKLKMPPENEIQAKIPRGAELWLNPAGTACPFVMKKNDLPAIFLPGVPSEIEAIFSSFLRDYLRKISGESEKQSFLIRTFGISESSLYALMSEKRKIFELSKVAFLPQIPGVDVRIEEKCGTDSLNDVRDEIVKCAGKWIWNIGENSIQQVVSSMLKDLSLTISVAESCTGGYISNMLTDVPGSSDYFKMSIVAYGNDVKKLILGVEKETLEKNGSVSPETAAGMAEKIRLLAETDIGLSSTGIAGPGGGSAEKPVGLLYTAVSSAKNTKTGKFSGFDDRLKNKKWFSFFVFDFLRRYLLDNFPFDRGRYFDA
ncbi:CinA family nicotinamide mononucleotide deamidase-related protein [candidate division WOR-3 bacterium]|nr:CinA family nicotinamide mononucleotide deamidase-related protein [candidate division WOR-3 bacterium]